MNELRIVKALGVTLPVFNRRRSWNEVYDCHSYDM